MTESLLLSLIGGLAGLAILFCTKGLLLRMMPESLPRLRDISINWSVLLFALAASLVAGAIFGLAPALHAGRLDLNHMLKQEGRGTKGSGEQARTRQALVVTEFALSLVLMIAAGLLLRSFWDLLNVPLGFNPQNVMAARTWLPVPNDPKTDIYGTAAQEAPFLREVLRRAQDAARSRRSGHWRSRVDSLAPRAKRSQPGPGDFRRPRDAEATSPRCSTARPLRRNYFHLLGMTLLRGRLFSDVDNETAPQVAVINEAFARTYWPNENPLGKRLKTTPRKARHGLPLSACIADARTESLAEASVPQIYLVRVPAAAQGSGDIFARAAGCRRDSR